MGDRQGPLMVSYGMGVDSTAILVGLAARGIRPDAILFADVGAEKDETYSYLDIINPWLEKQGFPQVTVVRYCPKNFKHWPEYHSLEENCLTNGTLPSEAFGFGSCSEKWKQQPQHKWTSAWAPAQEAWARGIKITKAIGYDCSETYRTFRAQKSLSDKYDYWYPLQDWGWDRERCKEEIRKVGLPVPPKSSCYFCPNMRKEEVRELPKDKLMRIVVLEARAKPRLTKIQGLWRTGCKGTRGGEKRPGSMTQFIREENLLDPEVIDALASRVPTELMDRNTRHAEGQPVESWKVFMARVMEESQASLTGCR